MILQYTKYSQQFCQEIAPKWKILGLFILNFVTLYSNNISVLLSILTFILIIYHLAALSIWHFTKQNTFILSSIVFLSLIQYAFTSWSQASMIGLHFLILIMSANWIAQTTSTLHMLTSLERFFTFLKPIGLQPKKISFMIHLSLRFIPLLQYHYYEIRTAQKARGQSFRMDHLLLPFILKIFQTSDAIAEALEARGYEDHDDEKRKK